MQCPNCGSEFDGKFCPDCGTPAPEGSNGQPGIQPMDQQGYQQQYGQQQYGQPYYSAPNPAITRREIVTCIIFTIITCGIYGIYWYIKLTDDTNTLVNEYGVSNGENLTTGGMVFLLTLITCGIYGYYWAYKQGERLDRVKAFKGMVQGNLSTTYLVLYIVLNLFTGIGGIVVYALMQNEINTLNQ